MNTQEFSDKFDTLLNSYARTFAPGAGHAAEDFVCDEYEKSVFLTGAQRDLVLSYYSGRNVVGISFEEKEEIREALDTLVKTLTPQELSKDSLPEGVKNLYDAKKIFTFYSVPKSLLFIVFEEVKFSSYLSGCMKGAVALVVPTTHDELWHKMRNPFRGPSTNRVLRVNAADNIVELVSDYPIGSYLLRYVDEPKPIILTDLNGQSIDGISVRTECQLPPVVHQSILETAVKEAYQTKLRGLSRTSPSRS